MMGKIALEEHFVPPELEHLQPRLGAEALWQEHLRRLVDTEDTRLEDMDANGIEMAVLSFSAPGVQDILDPVGAATVAAQANDAVAECVSRRPDRFAGFAALPMQDPEAATAEAVRAVEELGLRGVLVNSSSDVDDAGNGVFYDGPEYLDFWRELARLDVPFYLHPRNPVPANLGLFAGRPELLGPTWAFGVETGTHALRLITSGLFDRVPDLQVILGHLGENLPFAIERLDQRLELYPGVSFDRRPTQVLQENFHVTISGNYHTPSLIGVLLQLGADRILFATDYPFEAMDDAAGWLDHAPISAADRLKIGRTNAERLLGLGSPVV